MQRRILCLYLPHLATDRVRAEDAARSAAPLALTRRSGATLTVVYACPRAREAGVRPGLTLAQAHALAPGLAALDFDEHRDRALLLDLAQWAVRFSPLVEPLFPNALLLDITGCRRLFELEEHRPSACASGPAHGPQALAPRGVPANPDAETDALIARLACNGIRRRKLHVRAAIADTIGAAYALASTQCAGSAEPLVVPEGQSSAWLAQLPPAALRIDPRVADQLYDLGVRSIGDLLMLPRSTLPARFGQHTVLRIEQALGEIFEPITPWLPQPPPAARCPFETPVSDVSVMQTVAGELLDDVLAQVVQRERALRRLDCVLYRERTGPIVLPIELARASRNRKHIGELLTQRIEAAMTGGQASLDEDDRPTTEVFFNELLAPLPGFTGLMLIAAETPRWRALQGDLFEPHDPGDDEQFGGLLDRLINRLGRDAVLRAELVEDYQPEHACRLKPAAAEQDQKEKPALPANRKSKIENRKYEPSSPPRPTRLLPRPLTIRVTAVVPDGPPASMYHAGRNYALLETWGPERIETGWWRDSKDVRRDYYRVASDTGENFWIFHDAYDDQWYLHGLFA